MTSSLSALIIIHCTSYRQIQWYAWLLKYVSGCRLACLFFVDNFKEDSVDLEEEVDLSSLSCGHESKKMESKSPSNPDVHRHVQINSWRAFCISIFSIAIAQISKHDPISCTWHYDRYQLSHLVMSRLILHQKERRLSHMVSSNAYLPWGANRWLTQPNASQASTLLKTKVNLHTWIAVPDLQDLPRQISSLVSLVLLPRRRSQLWKSGHHQSQFAASCQFQARQSFNGR